MAIIQRQDLEEEHLDSAFWIGVGTALLFCIASNLLAAPIAHIFKEPKLAPVICWLSLSMVFGALSAVPTAILTRDMEFRPLAIRSLISTGIGGAAGVAMAIAGCGVWSLVGQQLIVLALGCVCLWFAVPWRPRFRVSKRHLRDLYGFSLQIAGNDVLWFFSKRSDQTMVAYSFGPDGLGPYSLASKIVMFLNDAVVGPLQSVALPALSKLQLAPEEFERAVCRYCEISSFLVFPLFAGIAGVAPELVPLLYGSKWGAAVPLLQVLAIYGAGLTVFSFTFPALVAKGRTGLQLITSTILSVMTVAGCMIGARFTPKAVAFSLIASYVLFGIGLLLIMRRVLQIRPVPLIKRIVYPATSSLFMLAAVALLRLQLRGWLASPITLCISIVTGVILYAGAARIFRPDLIRTIQDAFKASLHRTENSLRPPEAFELEEELASASTGLSEV